MNAAVLVLEPDRRLAHLVARYLAVHGIQTSIAAGRDQLQAALMLGPFTCVIAGPDFDDDEIVANLCLDAGVPLVIAMRFSGSELLARIDVVSRIS